MGSKSQMFENYCFCKLAIHTLMCFMGLEKSPTVSFQKVGDVFKCLHKKWANQRSRAISVTLALFDFFVCLFWVSPLVRYIQVDRESTLRKAPPFLTSPSLPSSGAIAKASLRRMAPVPRGYPASGEGNGNPLQDSCLGNPLDRGAWRTIVHGVAKSRTWLSD